jgi:tRNA(Ile)-lysidine synthase
MVDDATSSNEGELVVGELLGRCSFPDTPDQESTSAPMPLACALSGGPDSSALTALAVAAGFEVTAWHVNHGIRADSDADEEVARSVARDLDARFEVRRVVIAPGSNLEERAREARYQALPADVCTGHTADDRAETVLLNIGRGGGLAGASTRFDRVRRPLLELRRAETVALCRQMGLVVADDAMNRDTRYARAAVRHNVIPALAEALGRDPVPLLNRHARLAGDAAEVVAELAREIDPTAARALCAAPRAVASEAVRRWIMSESGSRTPPDAASVDRVLDVAAGRHVATEIEGGHRVARSANRLRLEPAPAANATVPDRH